MTVDIGVLGPSHTGTGTPTGTKRCESILWFNDGLWWANMWDVGTGDFYIFRLDASTQTWVRTSTVVDTRANTHADVLWTGTKLYIASHLFVNDGVAAVPGFPSNLYRFSYDPATKTYLGDGGFPTQINNYKTETLVIDRDSTGTLWATWQQDSRIYLNRTTGPTDTWGTPFPLPSAGDVTVDDNSSLIAIGDRVLVMWSDQNPATDGMYSSIHVDGAAPDAWSAKQVAISGPGSADDHINLKYLAGGGGKVFAATKTSYTQASQPLIQLLVFDVAAGSWSAHPIALVADCPNRVIVLIDEQNLQLHTFATYPTPPDFVCTSSGGEINEKTSPLDVISFPTGRGTPRILDADSLVHNVTSTKQNVNPATGITILADNNSTQRYWHASQTLGPPPPPTVVASFTAAPTSGVAPLTVAFTDTSTGSPTAWSWNFGDGGSSSAQNPSHVYSAAGTYTVTLTASNAGGSSNATATITATQQPPPAGIVRQSVSTVVNATATNTVTVGRPAGTVAGDLLVATIAVNGGSVSAGGVPAGWSPLASVTAIVNPRLFGYYKVATATEPASYSWGLTTSVANSGGIARYSGTSGLDASATQATGTGTQVTVPGVTTTVADAMLVGCAAANSSATSVTITSPAGLTAAWDLAGKRQELSDGRQAAAGASGNKTWTLSASREWAVFLVALRPA